MKTIVKAIVFMVVYSLALVTILLPKEHYAGVYDENGRLVGETVWH